MDLPFCPSVYALNKVMPIRDSNGAVRFLDHGNVPFDKETLARNQDLIQQRQSQAEGSALELVEADIYYFAEPAEMPDLT